MRLNNSGANGCGYSALAHIMILGSKVIGNYNEFSMLQLFWLPELSKRQA